MAVRFAAIALVLVCGCDDSRLLASGNNDAAAPPPDTILGTVDGFYAAPDAPGAVGVAPRLIAPMSTSTVTQRQPTLHWIGGASPVVDLCLDRACTRPLAIAVDVAASQTSGTVSSPLPPGWIYWRVRSAAGTSATWQFFVGQRSASTPVDTSSGTGLDINGDGFGDFIVAGSTMELHLGSPTGPQTVALIPPANAQYGGYLSNLGDINGDGYDDVFVWPHVLLGGPTTDGSIWNGDGAPNRLDNFFPFSAAPKPIGDVNGDGYADLWVPYGVTAGYVWFGQATPAPTNWILIDNPDATAPRFGVAAAGAGDVNGDGYADFIVGAYPTASDATSASAHLYLGSATPTANDWSSAATPNRVDLPGLHPTLPYAGGYGLAVSGAGDLNGDGYSDFVVGSIYAGAGSAGIAYVYFGSAVPGSAPPIDLEGLAPNNMLGRAMTPVGDVNADGYTDLLVSEVDYLLSPSGGARLYLGGPSPSAAGWNGSTPTSRVDLPSPHSGASDADFAHWIASGGDTDGDGYADFLIAAPGAVTAHLYRGEVYPDPTHWDGATASMRIDIVFNGAYGYYGTVE